MSPTVIMAGAVQAEEAQRVLESDKVRWPLGLGVALVATLLCGLVYCCVYQRRKLRAAAAAAGATAKAASGDDAVLFEAIAPQPSARESVATRAAPSPARRQARGQCAKVTARSVRRAPAVATRAAPRSVTPSSATAPLHTTAAVPSPA